MVRLKGEIIIEKHFQLVIDLEGDDVEGYHFEEGQKVIIEGNFKKWDE